MTAFLSVNEFRADPMSGAALHTAIRSILLFHKPVDIHFSAVEFEVNCAQCTCGKWAGPGSCFEDHRASAIAEYVRKVAQ